MKLDLGKTLRLLRKQFGKCDSLRRLERFISFVRKRNEAKNLEPISKLSFEVKYSIFGLALTK